MTRAQRRREARAKRKREKESIELEPGLCPDCGSQLILHYDHHVDIERNLDSPGDGRPMNDLYCLTCRTKVLCRKCGMSMWTCGYCKIADADFEGDKWIAEFQNPNTSEERKQEMFLKQDREMVLDDLKSCPLTREQVKMLFELRDSFAY